MKLKNTPHNILDAATALLLPTCPALTADNLVAALREYPENGTPSVAEPSKKLLTLRQAAERLAISRTTLWRLCQDGTLPKPLQIGLRSPRLPEAAIDKLCQGGAK